MNRKKIVLGYLKRWLFYDFLTSIPLTFLFSFVSDLKTDHALRIASVGMVVLRLPRAVRSLEIVWVMLTNGPIPLSAAVPLDCSSAWWGEFQAVPRCGNGVRGSKG